MDIVNNTKKKTNLLYSLSAIFNSGKWSKWIDVGCYEVSGYYFLMQMQFHLTTNKKRFRRAKMGWVNDYMSKPEIFEQTKKYNAH